MSALIKTLIFTLLAPGSLVVWIPLYLVYRGPEFELGAARALGLLPMLLGAAIYLRCAWDFVWTGRGTPALIDPPKTLVATGLYRWTRNPMYVGMLLLLAGEAVFFESLAILKYALLVALAFHLWVVFYEEPALRKKFGPAYEQYRRQVRRWLPQPPGKGAGG